MRAYSRPTKRSKKEISNSITMLKIISFRQTPPKKSRSDTKSIPLGKCPLISTKKLKMLKGSLTKTGGKKFKNVKRFLTTPQQRRFKL